MLGREPVWEEWKKLFTDKRSWTDQVWGGFSLATSLVIGFVIFVCLLIGLDLLCFPEKPPPDYFAGRHPLSLGVTLVAISTLVIFATVPRWVKALPGFIG